LEIYADDVKCSHGATAGQLDEGQLFYLQTRGIAAPLAKRLLLEAFGSEIIDSVALTTLQDYLYDKLVAKLVKL
jgi:Fe-S cluster assembly protein SufD